MIRRLLHLRHHLDNGGLEPRIVERDSKSQCPCSGTCENCLMLIEAAVRLPKYKEILHTPEEKGDAVVEEMGLDKLSLERIQELQQLLGMLEKLKS